MIGKSIGKIIKMTGEMLGVLTVVCLITFVHPGMSDTTNNQQVCFHSKFQRSTAFLHTNGSLIPFIWPKYNSLKFYLIATNKP